MSQRWNYQVIEIPMQMFGKSITERAQEELNRQGQLGWELVSSVPSSSAYCVRLFLKRPA